MTPDQERTIHRLESRVDELTRRVQQLEAERQMRPRVETNLPNQGPAQAAVQSNNYQSYQSVGVSSWPARPYPALNRDKEAPGTSLGIRDQSGIELD